MDKQQFNQWRAELRLTQSKAAEALCLSLDTVKKYGSGDRGVPDYIAKLCAYIQRHGDIGHV